MVEDDDEVLVVLASGKVVRSAVAEVPAKGRDTMGVVFARFAEDDKIIAVAKNSERDLDSQDGSDDDEGEEIADVELEQTGETQTEGEPTPMEKDEAEDE
jgi:DNA gyrase subunit A